MSNSEFFDPRGFGVIKAKPSELYDKAKSMRRTIAIVRDNHRIDPKKYDYERAKKIFDYQHDNQAGASYCETEAVYRSKDLLDFFLNIHNRHVNTAGGTLTESSLNTLKTKTYKLADIVFLEIKDVLRSDMEYSILMFFYLLNLRFWTSEFYVIVDYETDKFNFIETDIFRRTTPIPNYLPKREVEEINIERFNFEMYLTSFRTRDPQIHFIVSDTNIYETEFHPAIEGLHKVFDTLQEYKNFQKMNLPTSHEGVIIIKFQSLEEVVDLKVDLKPSIVVINTRTKVQTSLLYGGNVLIQKPVNHDYIREKAKIIKIKNPETKLMFFTKDLKSADKPVTREIFEKSPISDFIKFEKSKVDILSLYVNFCPNNSHFISLLRSEIEILKYIGYKSNTKSFSLCHTHNIHPVMVAIINKWFEFKNKAGENLPRFPILLFTAVVTTFDKKIIEVKEHGDRERASNINEISRFGLEMMAYMNKMRQVGECVFKDSKASDRLKSLIDFFKISPREICDFDVNEFAKFLIRILETNFKDLLLVNKSYSTYRGFHNDQLNWWISQASAPNKIFPIIVHSSSNNKMVTLFIPIDHN